MKPTIESLPDRIHATAQKLMGVKPRRIDPRETDEPVFATFQDRTIASMLDVGLIYLLLKEVFAIISQRVFVHMDIAAYEAALMNAPAKLTLTDEVRYAVEAAYETGILELWLLNSFLQSLLIGALLVFSWQKFHLTPGKYIMGLEFAGKNGEGKPSLRQYLLRFAGYYISMPVFMIGFAVLGFDKKKRAVHDHIAGTTVIYAKRGSVFRMAWDWLKAKWKNR